MVGYRKVLQDKCNHGWLQESFTGNMQSWLVTGRFYRRNAIMIGYRKLLLHKCNNGWLQEGFTGEIQ